MIDQIKDALGKAHSSIKQNPVVVWFPALFNTAAAVFMLLAAVIVLMPVIPELFTTPDALNISPELLAGASGRAILLLVLSVPVLIAANAGAIFMQARAVKGEQVDTAHFLLGVRVLGLRILGGSLIVWAAYGLVFVLSVLVFAQGIVRLLAERGLDSIPSPDVLAEIVLRTLPLLIVGVLLLSLISILFSMWARILALREVGVMQAVLGGLQFVLRNFFIIALMLLMTWLITTLTQPIVERLPLGGVLVVIFSYMVRVYLSITLMHIYLNKTDTSAP